MKLTVLGSGTFVPNLNRQNASYLLQDSRNNFVIDFGRGAINRLMEAGVSIYEIDSIFITHFAHPDHTADLLSLLFSLNVPANVKDNRKKDLYLYGPEGIKKYIKKMFGLMESPTIKLKLVVKEVSPNETIKIDDWKITNFKVKHLNKSALAYRFEKGNKIISFSGDSSYCDGLKKAIKSSDLAVLESTWPKNIEPGAHMTAEDAGKISLESNVKKLILSHILDSYLRNYDLIKSAKKYFKGPIIIAKDLMEIEICE